MMTSVMVVEALVLWLLLWMHRLTRVDTCSMEIIFGTVTASVEVSVFVKTGVDDVLADNCGCR